MITPTSSPTLPTGTEKRGILSTLLPRLLDNRYRGRSIALWIFGLLVLLEVGMSVSSIGRRFPGGNSMTRLATLLGASLSLGPGQENAAEALERVS